MSDDAGKIKSAASILLKGGTLVSEQCAKCGGVQVRFGGRTRCINCEEETKEEKQVQQPASKNPVGTIECQTIECKIKDLTSELSDEKDLAIQRQMAELLEIYLRILERMKGLTAG